MCINASLSSNDSTTFPSNSSVKPAHPFGIDCYLSGPSSMIFRVYNLTYMFIFLPVCFFILHHGFQQWSESRSRSSAAMSHSDSFTYHLVTMEMIGIVGCFLNLCAIFVDRALMLVPGLYFSSFIGFGEMFFHILTCLERYLAVIHPITYLSLRAERGIRLRKVCIVCVWLFSFVGISLIHNQESFVLAMNFITLMCSLMVVSFCSVSVLCVLVRPGPGEQGGIKERADQLKRRALYTIFVILGVLVVRFTWDLTVVSLYVLEGGFNCITVIWSFWLYLPSSLVLPLLFLLTKKKLTGPCFCWSRGT